MIPLSRIVMLFCLVGAGFGAAGCSKPESPQTKPEVVRSKITEKPEPAVKPTSTSTSTSTLASVPIRTQTPVSPEVVPQQQASPAVPIPVPSDTDFDQKKSSEMGEGKPFAVEVSSASISYNPVGKIDPFVPLFRDEPDKPVQPEKVKREKREPMTPLERIDLSQLKLTAIIQTPSGFKAMVEESTGQGYIVGVGTYIGSHSGKIVNILKDRIVVEEEIEDALGNVTNRNSDLKFQKPFGD